MVVVGGGAIGVELASAFARMGTVVNIIEYADQIIPLMDRELGKELNKILSKAGIIIRTASKVQSAILSGDSVTIEFLDAKGDRSSITADYCLVAAGRRPYTEGLSLENTKIRIDQKGRIEVNGKLKTAEENIYAIGDVIAGPMLAHKAEEDAIFVSESIHGLSAHLDYSKIPSVVYSWPEVASVGQTEEELKKQGIAYRVGKFPFLASGRARAAMETDGFVKILSEPTYGEVLGAHIIGARAADLIAFCVAGIHFETTDKEVFKMPFAHPTFSEAIKEAFLIASGQGSINF